MKCASLRLVGPLGLLLLLDVGGYLLPLPLGGGVGAEPLLAELQGALVLGDLEQLNAPLLVAGVADDLADDLPDVHGLLGDAAAGPRVVILVAGQLADLVAFVGAGAELVGDGHFGLTDGSGRLSVSST